MEHDRELRIIHALRLKGFADTPVVAEAACVGVDDATKVLEALAVAEHARYRDGPMTGWTLLPAGRACGESLLAEQLDRAGHRDVVANAYQQFLALNQQFLKLCTDWQVRDIGDESVINDHGDTDYDCAVVCRLAETDRAVQPICADLASLFPRFGSYGPRFGEALSKVEAGHIEWFTKPVIDSYHTIWFELHEDLLASLGIARSKEGST